ncbi:MAG: hypothetical protein ACUVX8_08125 [Candidatus Zipacnadales bacterium]
MFRRPDILWICTQRFDTIHSLRNPHIRTPNLDRLVQQGAAFTHAYAQSPPNGQKIPHDYDLEAEPHEFANLWPEPGFEDLKLDLLRRCLDAGVFTVDPEPQRKGAG